MKMLSFILILLTSAHGFHHAIPSFRSTKLQAALFDFLLPKSKVSARPIAVVKKELLEATDKCGINGKFGSAAERARVCELVVELEKLNPTRNPATRADLNDGFWKLLFTTVPRGYGNSDGSVGPFTAPVYQDVNSKGNEVRNLLKFESFPFEGGIVVKQSVRSANSW